MREKRKNINALFNNLSFPYSGLCVAGGQTRTRMKKLYEQIIGTNIMQS